MKQVTLEAMAPYLMKTYVFTHSLGQSVSCATGIILSIKTKLQKKSIMFHLYFDTAFYS